MHQSKVLARVRICVSGFHGILGERILNRREKRWGGGGGTVRGPVPFGITSDLKVFQVDVHHFLKHLSCLGIFGKTNVLKVGVKSLES